MKAAFILPFLLPIAIAWSSQRRHELGHNKHHHGSGAHDQYQPDQHHDVERHDNQYHGQPPNAIPHTQSTTCTETTASTTATGSTTCDETKPTSTAASTTCDEQSVAAQHAASQTTITITSTSTRATSLSSTVAAAQSYEAHDNAKAETNSGQDGRKKVAPTPTTLVSKPSSSSKGTAVHEIEKPSKEHDHSVVPNGAANKRPVSSEKPSKENDHFLQTGDGAHNPPSTSPEKPEPELTRAQREEQLSGTHGATNDKKLGPDIGAGKANAKPVPKPTTPYTSPNGKRGVLMSGSSQDAYAKAFSAHPGKITWVGDWFSSAPTPLDTTKFDFVPQMYHGSSDDSKPNEAPHPWTTNAEKAVTAKQKYFLSFGEPNTNNTADDGKNTYMDAKTGAKTFKDKMNKYAVDDGVRIGSPGTLGGTLDIDWQNDFLDECANLDCKIGFVGCHWVTPCGDASAQKLADTFWGTVGDYIDIAKKHSKQYGVELKVWVDNFGMTCKSETQKEFLDIVVPMLEKEQMIERYMYVSFDENGQVNSFVDGEQLSELGQHYADM